VVAYLDRRTGDADGSAGVVGEFDYGELEGQLLRERFASGVQFGHRIDNGCHRE
jgi:hypothetical protein